MTLLHPGVEVRSRALSSRSGVPTDTGTWFVSGLAERGAAGVPLEVTSLAGFVSLLGDRVSYGLLYDAADVFFREGGARIVASRVVGPAAVLATRSLLDRAATTPLNTLRVDALGAGDWGNSLTVSVANGVATNTFVLIIKRAGVEVERSPELTDPAAAALWGNGSAYVRVTNLASATAAPNNNPAVIADSALTGGTDDRAAITETQWTNALAVFGATLGPGQVSAPGRTTAAAHAALLAHAETRNRTAILDGADTATVGTLTTAADAARTAGDDAYAGLFAPWLLVPGVVPGTTRTVPPSPLVAGLIARSDATSDAGAAPAGDQGVGAGRSRYAFDVSRTFTDADWDTLNAAGVNLTIKAPLGIELYGFRSLDKGEWLQLTAGRLRMQLTAGTNSLARGFVFRRIDGRGQVFAELEGALAGYLLPFYERGSLFGESFVDAVDIDTGPTVNTAASIAAGELKAAVYVRFSPFAEKVLLDIVKVSIDSQAV